MDENYIVASMSNSRITCWRQEPRSEKGPFEAKYRGIHCFKYRYPIIVICYSNNIIKYKLFL